MARKRAGYAVQVTEFNTIAGVNYPCNVTLVTCASLAKARGWCARKWGASPPAGARIVGVPCGTVLSVPSGVACN